MLRRLYHQYAIQNHTVRTTVETVRGTKANISHFLRQLPDLHATQVTGDLGSVIFVGHDDPVKLQILDALFTDGYEETPLNQVAVRNLPRQVPRWTKEHDLVICRVSRFFPIPVKARYSFDNPLTIQHILLLNHPLEEILSGGDKRNLRNEINRMHKRQYSKRLSHSKDDLRFFYHQMYLPTLLSKHGDRAEVYPFEYLEKLMQSGFLMFLSLDHQPVLGSLCYISGNTLCGSCMGLMNGQQSLMKHDVTTALYWYSIDTTIAHNLEAFNFMGSNAWTSDGLFRFKRRWGAEVHHNPYATEKLLLRADHLSTAWRDRINAIGFLTRKGQDHLQIYIDEATPSVEEAHALAVKNGLKGIQIIKPGQRENIAELRRVNNASAVAEK